MADIELRNISKSYGGTEVINSLNLSIRSGEFVTLLGPSGCGKSTTLKVIAGLVQPDAGAVLVDGKDVTSVPVNQRNIGMVFQSLALFPHLTVGENIMFGLLRRNVSKAEAKRQAVDALDLVRLSDYFHRNPSQLSGGQQQRVALARAFVSKPAMMLLDEPLGALDRKLREDMQIEIRQLTRQLSVTAIFVTHDQHEAIVMSDRIAVMNLGRIEQIDRPEVVFEKPRTPFVAHFVGVSNFLHGRMIESGFVEIDSGRGSIRLKTHGDNLRGSNLRVGLRPETAIIYAEGDVAPDDAILCGVTDAVYQGAQLSLDLTPVATPDLCLRARVPTANRPQSLGRLAPGQKLLVHWPAESILLYPEP
jgi:ABC-type Fe3+/spermidine/putrescine transport system ATPase subunit